MLGSDRIPYFRALQIIEYSWLPFLAVRGLWTWSSTLFTWMASKQSYAWILESVAYKCSICSCFEFSSGDHIALYPRVHPYCTKRRGSQWRNTLCCCKFWNLWWARCLQMVVCQGFGLSWSLSRSIQTRFSDDWGIFLFLCYPSP